MSNENDTNNKVSLGIRQVVSALMDRVMERTLIEDPFVVESHRSNKPLYAALVPDEIFKGSHFERRFVTPFGGVWEKLALIVADEYHGNCTKGHTLNGNVRAERLRRIQEVLNNLESGESPNWNQEVEYINNGGGELIPTRVICDIFIDSNLYGQKYAFEIKAPLPNSDQTKVSKEKMLKLLAMQPRMIDKAFFALPYNPYGKKEDYAWGFPKRWFSMLEDRCVLIGQEFWDLVGGSGTYSNFIIEINKLGENYRERIYKEYLGIEPPDNTDEFKLT
jgi:hypothetical protein